uniref:C2H2-type domain-containing protein n=1 Tax=Anopheles farauti TaxID=69004 RepID=A0A182QYY4_9DIPT
MPPEAGETIELTERTCRLCLGNQEELMQMESSLTPNEKTNIIERLLKINLDSNWPFQSACHKCIMKVQLIENIRVHFEEKNRFFDVMFTQYKRIHYPQRRSPNKGTIQEDSNSSSEYVIESVVVEKPDLEDVPPDVLLKEADENLDMIIKQEELDHEPLEMYENFMLDEDALVEEDKDEMEDSMVEEFIEEHIVEMDNEHEQIDPSAAIASEQQSNEVYEMQEELDESIYEEDGFYDSSINRCQLCLDTFQSDSQLQTHLEETHKDVLPFHCSKCLLYIDEIGEVNVHLISHQYAYGCLYCSQRYNSEELLQKHNQTCCKYRCQYCTAEFEIMAHLNAHKKLHKAQQRALNKCKSCGKTFSMSSNLQRHLRTHRACKLDHMERKKRTRALAQEQKAEMESKNFEVLMRNLRVCQVCNEKFESNCYLARHIEREHSEFSFPLYGCDICPKKFTAFDKCIRHRAYHRRSVKKPDAPSNGKKPEGRPMCKICNKEFRMDSQLLRHLSEDHALSLELFECDQCARKFSTELKLRKHQYNSHRTNKTLYVCSHCGQKFEKKLTLKDHETKHLGTPAYRCELCDKQFIHKHSLDRHALVHSDEKQFSCDFCEKKFKRNTALVIHRRIHTGEKPYHCEPCNMRFIDSSTLIKHRQRQHPKQE